MSRRRVFNPPYPAPGISKYARKAQSRRDKRWALINPEEKGNNRFTDDGDGKRIWVRLPHGKQVGYRKPGSMKMRTN